MKLKRDGWGFTVSILPAIVQQTLLYVSIGLVLFIGLKLHDRNIPEIRVPGNVPTDFQPGFVYWTEGTELLSARISEDMAGIWDCRTMGNRVCGSK